jgi:tripartite-type tricarboxylate transporter receptor subunit TctC
MSHSQDRASEGRNLMRVFSPSAVAFGAAIAWLTGAAAVAAQDGAADFPKIPVHIVVPFAAAGATDIGARIIGQKLSEEWGEPVIIENKPGATGAIAAEYVAKANPMAIRC